MKTFKKSILCLLVCLMLAAGIQPLYAQNDSWKTAQSNVEGGLTYYVVNFVTDEGLYLTALVNSGGLVLPEAPHREGYTFLRWECEGRPVTDGMSVNHDLTITAVFEPIVLVDTKILYVYEEGGKEVVFGTHSATLTLDDVKTGAYTVVSPEYTEVSGVRLWPERKSVSITAEDLSAAAGHGNSLSFTVSYMPADLSYTLVRQLTALNESGWTDDARIVFLPTRAKAYSEQTGGALDITLLPASRCWGFTTGSYGVPFSGDLEALRDRIGMDKITLTDAAVSIPDGTNLDFGALAKGYAADLCREKLEEAGIPGILSLGGSIQTVGTKPDGSAWMIGVQDPDDPGRYALTLQLNGAKAVVTSGDYQRYFMQDSVRYCHILDPKTLSPVRGTLRAVTVVAAEGLRADALSTALFVLGREAGTELWRSQRDFEVIWMEDDGTIWLTSGLKDLASGSDFEVIEP